MNYELAKKLYESGYKMSRACKKGLKGEHQCRADRPDCDFSFIEPTLSQLIEACGKQFHRLVKTQLDPTDKTPWVAYPTDDVIRNARGFAVHYSASPEEAVANLWLALHENKNI